MIKKAKRESSLAQNSHVLFCCCCRYFLSFLLLQLITITIKNTNSSNSTATSTTTTTATVTTLHSLLQATSPISMPRDKRNEKTSEPTSPAESPKTASKSANGKLKILKDSSSSSSSSSCCEPSDELNSYESGIGDANGLVLADSMTSSQQMSISDAHQESEQVPAVVVPAKRSNLISTKHRKPWYSVSPFSTLRLWANNNQNNLSTQSKMCSIQRHS